MPPDLTRGEQYLPGSLIVGYRQNSGLRVLALPQAARVSDQTGGLQQLNAVVIDVPVGQEEQVRQELLQNPDVLYVERNGIVRAFAITPDDPFWDRQYGPQMIHMPDAWEALASMTTSPVTLAIIDSGLDTSHPDFAGRLVPGYDFVEKDNTPQDACGHGTHVAGIAAATGNNGIGIAGINWTARIMPVRVLDENCGGSFANLANGILYAVDHGANVINLSLGSLSASNLVESAVFQAYSRGVTIVAAAGNQQNGNGLPIIAYPAAYPWALAVGAVGKDRQRAGFSNYASEQDQRLVMAPGVDILSIIPGGNYQYMDGTSMATAHVSGAAALLAGLSQFNTPDKLFQAIYKTADSSIGPRAGWDNETGYGLVQIDLALNFSQFEPPPPLPTTNIDYDMVSSINCGELPYQWIDAASGGRFLLLNSNDARVQVDFSGGKQFTFGGRSYASVEVSANGYLRFGSSPEQAISDKTNDPIPAISQPNNFAAPFWADLSSPNGMQLYAKQEGDLFVVEWYKVSYQGYTLAQSELTFEVILNFNTGQIIYQYQTLKGVYADGALATVGVEYADGTAGSQYSYNRKGALKPGLAILFSPAEKGSTRTLQGCLFVTQAQFRGCNQLPPFRVDQGGQPLPARPGVIARDK
ncbi:MAG TPA: S8 family peptidase [Anaerolineales bacterium]